MQIPSRFTIAVHIFACIDYFKDTRSITSEFLAGSININPVIVRQILLKLKAAGLINISRGRGSMSIARPINEITLYNIYEALECVGHGRLFHFHERPNTECPVGRNIHRTLDDRLNHIQELMENELKQITIADIAADARKYILSEAQAQ